MTALILAFAVSFALGLWVISLATGSPARRLTKETPGPQTVHVKATPRLGGACVFAGVVVAAAYFGISGRIFKWEILLPLLACSLPAFLVGLWHDLHATMTPKGRLLATALSAAAAFWWLGASIDRTAIPPLDLLVATSAGSLLLTVFTVAGIANAINIIDGLNGLASMCGLMMLSALTYGAYQSDDYVIATLALSGVGALAGFFVWNFPAGLLFLGDAGAYFVGFFVAELSILLLVRNQEVSPLFPLLFCIYPVFETLFSVYRRWFLKDTHPALADGIHLHSLLFRRLMRLAVGRRSVRAMTRSNSMTSPLLWILCMLSVAPAMVFWDDTAWLAIFIILFALSYLYLYWRIVRFRTPRWLRRTAGRTLRVPPGHVTAVPAPDSRQPQD